MGQSLDCTPFGFKGFIVTGFKNWIATINTRAFGAAQVDDPKLELAFHQSLRQSSHQGERRIALIRALAFVSVAALDVYLAELGLRPFENLLGSVPVALVSCVLWWFLFRYPVTGQMQIAVPLMDAYFIFWLLTNRALDAADLRQMSSTIALVCALLAASGGLRLRVRGVLWSTGLAGGLFWWFIARGSTDVESGRTVFTWLYGVVSLFGVGILAIWTVQLAKEAARLSQARVVMQRFLPANLVSQAFDRPNGDWNQPRSIDATIVFSDIRGFTTWSESRAPESVLAALSELQGRLADAVQAEDGIVDKFLGDGMLAVFGTSSSESKHAEQAIAAVHRMRRVVKEYNEEHNSTFRLGIAAHSGPVVLGCLGNLDRLEMTVIGDTVNTTSRLESETKKYNTDVLVSSTTAERAHLDLPEIARFTPRGKSEAITVHKLPLA